MAKMKDDRREPEGKITLTLDFGSALLIGNLIAKNAALHNRDLISAIQIGMQIEALEGAMGPDRLNGLADAMTAAIKSRWPDVSISTGADFNGCNKKGHCACDVGEPCCFCGETLTASSKRRPNVAPKGSPIEEPLNAKRTTPPFLH